MQPIAIPPSHRDLVEGTFNAILTTLMPDGQPQTTPVWFNMDGDYLLVNTMSRFQKAKNMQRDPRVALLIYDPHHPHHHVEIRGEVVEMTEQGALEHLDSLTRRYMHKPDAHFFGDSVPAELAATHTPVKVTIAPRRVRVEG